MTRLILAASIGVLLVASLPAQQPTFRSGVQTVAVYATVQDRAGQLVPNLTREDFQVFDNGRPAEITTFSNDIVSITVALMLDMSASMTTEFMRVRDGALHFVEKLLPADRARIGSFGTEVAVSPLLTGDRALLSRVIHEEMWVGGGTPLWSALHGGMESLAGESGRRVVLILTDGIDNCNLRIRREALIERAAESRLAQSGCVPSAAVSGRALENEFMVYAVGMRGGVGDVAGLASDSGGGHFVVQRGADLAATFARVAEELHHQYSIGFRPATLDGKSHKLEIRTTRRGLTVRSRKNYLALNR